MLAHLYVSHMCAGTSRGQQKSSDPLELELHIAVSHALWVHGIKPRALLRRASTLNHRDISLILLNALPFT